MIIWLTLIFETSRQARSVVLIALSPGFGVLFATANTLLFVHCLYLYSHDTTDKLHDWLGIPQGCKYTEDGSP